MSALGNIWNKNEVPSPWFHHLPFLHLWSHFLSCHFTLNPTNRPQPISFSLSYTALCHSNGDAIKSFSFFLDGSVSEWPKQVFHNPTAATDHFLSQIPVSSRTSFFITTAIWGLPVFFRMAVGPYQGMCVIIYTSLAIYIAKTFQRTWVSQKQNLWEPQYNFPWLLPFVIKRLFAHVTLAKPDASTVGPSMMRVIWFFCYFNFLKAFGLTTRSTIHCLHDVLLSEWALSCELITSR